MTPRDEYIAERAAIIHEGGEIIDQPYGKRGPITYEQSELIAKIEADGKEW